MSGEPEREDRPGKESGVQPAADRSAADRAAEPESEEPETLVARPSRRSLPAPAEPEPELEPTTVDEDAPTSVAAEPTTGPTRGTTSTMLSSGDFLRADDVNRIHAFSGGMLFVVVAGLACVSILPAAPMARAVASTGLVIYALGFGWLRIVSRTIDRYDPQKIGMLALALAATSAAEAYYFGVVSPFPCVVALALYNYALGAPRWFAFGVYVAVATPQALLGFLIAFGVIPDHGLVTTRGMPLITQIVAQTAVQLVYAIAYLVARASARRTRETVEALEAAVRQVGAREALLREARLELERAAGIGDPGRFTEQQLGSFRLGVVIGRGGMGEIYEASHLDTGEPAAVKLLQRGALAAEGDPIERFEREAAIAASIMSPYVVQVLEIGGADAPLPYLAMERLQGHDLAWHLRHRRRLKMEQVRELVAHVAEGLKAAQAKRIVHRDLKPQNLFRTAGDEGVWKILDFGVSKLAGEPGTLTAGHLVGTPAYMAPEQASAEGMLDHRVDVYALAVIAYRTLTGRPAFSGKDVPRVVHSVVHSLPPRPTELVELPPGIDHVLRVGMAKAADDRFDDALALRDALAAALDGVIDRRLRDRADRLNEDLDWGGTAG